MRLPATARWIGLALLGMLIAAAVSIAASKVASQQIGLASEPISAGDSLAPRSLEKERRQPTPSAQPQRRPAQPVLTPPSSEAIPPTQGDDSGGSSTGDGEHAGGGADD